MGMQTSVDVKFGDEVEVRGQDVKVKGTITVPMGFNVRPFIDNIGSALDALADGDGQTRLEFDSLLRVDPDKVKLVVPDKPDKRRKTFEFKIEVDVSGAGGFETQSTLFNLAQTKKPVILKLVAPPKPGKAKAKAGDDTAKTEKGKAGAAGKSDADNKKDPTPPAQPGEKGAAGAAGATTDKGKTPPDPKNAGAGSSVF